MIIKEYFTDDELKCKCCGQINMKHDFVERLMAARIIADIPFQITSGYRCIKHNIEIESKYMNHPHGRAVDISCKDFVTRGRIISALISAGFTRIGIAENMIHVDNMNIEGVKEGIWIY